MIWSKFKLNLRKSLIEIVEFRKDKLMVKVGYMGKNIWGRRLS